MKIIPLSAGGGKYKGLYFAEVDDEDYDRVSQFTWQVGVSKRNAQYALRSVYIGGGRKNNKKIAIMMHRFIMNVDDESIIVDHRNHNGLNNQKYNLRACTKKENSRNRVSVRNSTSKYIGVHRHVSRYQTKAGTKESVRWQATIGIGGRMISVGCFQNEDAAARARDAKAKELFGEFANLNFKNENKNTDLLLQPGY